jgi:hypothetical protein
MQPAAPRTARASGASGLYDFIDGAWVMEIATDLQVRPRESKGRRANAAAIYISMILIAALGASLFKARTQTIFSCQGNLYTSDRYIAYCNGVGYGDYEHGAFALGLEPAALEHARQADVLFLGNSHLQVAFSTPATAEWFSARSSRYYLMGFTYYENMVFESALLRKIRPTAAVYVINVDNFFRQWESPPARETLTDPGARSRFEEKRFWQWLHQSICGPAPELCGHQLAYYRSRETGAYTRSGGGQNQTAVSYDTTVDQAQVASDSANAVAFLSQLPVKRDCVILTMTPTVGTDIANVKATAKSLGMDLIAPELSGLKTFDGSHLEAGSAERWSQAFFQAAGPRISSCLKARQTVSQVNTLTPSTRDGATE